MAYLLYMGYFLSLRTILVAISVFAGTLVASVILTDNPMASIYVTPPISSVSVGDTIDITVKVKSNVPVNAFTGELIFDTDYFFVSNINYSTSIANLWVEEPWYNRANNSLYFAGGTTVDGGFAGTGELMKVTLQAKTAGDTTLTLHNIRVMAHDGLGSDIQLSEPLDTLFSIDTTPFITPIQETDTNSITIVQSSLPLDVNKDGILSFQDVSTLLFALGSNKVMYDFNGDGAVTWADIRTWQQLRKLCDS